MLLTTLYWDLEYLITPEQLLKPRFYENFMICLLFSRKQQLKLIICC